MFPITGRAATLTVQSTFVTSVLVALVALAMIVDAGAQAPTQPGAAAAPSGIILGKVVDAATNTPLPGVVVGFGGAPPARAVSALTDSQGRFVFRNVPKGAVTLRATVGGTGYSPAGFFWSGLAPQIGPYLDGGYGQRRPGGPMQTLDIDEGERLADVVIRMWKCGSIDGTVVDESGEPLVNVLVAASRRSADAGLDAGEHGRRVGGGGADGSHSARGDCQHRWRERRRQSSRRRPAAHCRSDGFRSLVEHVASREARSGTLRLSDDVCAGGDNGEPRVGDHRSVG
jgi:hypothetical protein